jgi:ChaB
VDRRSSTHQSEVTMPARDEMPSTIRRSGAKARRTWRKVHDAAVESYGEGERAHRTAFAALKHTHEKIGDHWEPKDTSGPSDERAADPSARRHRGGTATGGVDVLGHTKRELLERARDLDIAGRSSMSKDELARAIKKANDRASARARRSGR